MPGHNYTGPGNPLEKQLKHDSTGRIIEIYQQPTGKTDAVSMQHDVDYTVVETNPKVIKLNARMKPIERWSKLLMQYLGKKDNGDIQ